MRRSKRAPHSAMAAPHANGWVKISLAIFSFGMALGAAELIVRATAPQELVPTYARPDAELGYVIKPHQTYVARSSLLPSPYQVRTNGMGLRMEDEVDGSPARKKILVLGDSFTFGFGVDVRESFFVIIRSDLEQVFPEVQLLNAGVGGYSTGHATRYLKRLNRQLDISGVIYFMNHNDLFENVSTDIDYRVMSYRLTPDGEAELHDELLFSPLHRFLLLKTPYPWFNQHSHLWMFVKPMVKRLARGSRETATPAGAPYVTPHVPPPQLRLMQQVSFAHVRKLAGYCREQAIPLQIIWIPSWEETFPVPEEDSRSMRRAYKAFKQRVATEEAAHHEAVDFFDPADALRRLVQNAYTPSDFYVADAHWKPIGNQLYAATVISAVRRFIQRMILPAGT